MGTWTNQGFVAQDTTIYKAKIQKIFTDAFGDDFIVDDDTLPQGILIQELAELFANADADSIQVLTQLNVNTMSGIWLDLVAMARGLSRLPGSAQTVPVTVVSNPNYLPLVIQEGQVFTCNETGDQFVLKETKAINTASDTITLTYSGEGNSSVAVGDHFHTEDVPGIVTITAIGVTSGRERESDADFRARLKITVPVFNPTNEHVMSEIKKLQDIRGVGCAYNDTDTTVDSIPPYSTEFLVAPTANVDKETEQYTIWKEAVGKAILWNKVPGSPTYGNVTVNIEDPFGTLKDVSFSTPDEVSVGVTIEASVNEQVGTVDLGELEAIKQEVADYINSLPVGTDIAYSKIIQIFMGLSSMDVVGVTFKNMSTQTEYSNQNYVIETRQYAECASVEVEY